MPTTDAPIYAVYCRLSRKKATGRRGRQRRDNETVVVQEAIIRKYAAEKGLAISEAHIYVDNHRSAWKPTGWREAWNAKIAAGRRHEFDGLLAYKLDRFVRNMRDAEDLVDLAGKRRVVVDGPNSGEVDLSTAHARRTFREAAVQAAAESDNTSERVRSAFAELTSEGMPLGGGRIFGYELLSEVEDVPEDVYAVQRPDEVEVVREVAARMLAGEPVSHLANDLNDRGITTTRGTRWTGSNLGRLLGHDRYGGHVTIKGKRVGRIKGEPEPVLDEETFERVQAMLAGRRRGRRPTGRWPLSGVLICANPNCPTPGHTLAGTTAHHRKVDGTQSRQYTCTLGNGGCGLTVLAEPVEALVAEKVLAELSDPEVAKRMNAKAGKVNTARADAAQAVADLDESLAELEVKRAEGEIRPLAYEKAKAVLDRRLAHALTAFEALGPASGPQAALPVLSAEEWADLTGIEQRRFIDRLGLRITILPAFVGGSRKVFNRDRVQIEIRSRSAH